MCGREKKQTKILNKNLRPKHYTQTGQLLYGYYTCKKMNVCHRKWLGKMEAVKPSSLLLELTG